MVDPGLALGAAVVKTACKLWLKDSAEVAITVAGLVESRVADARERRRIRRLFDEMEERVADTLLGALEHEYASIPDHERAATVLAVADSFEESTLDIRGLVAVDLDPITLQRGLPDRTRDLSADATALYHRVTAGCCTYVVEMANLLPGFDTGVFTELLGRQSELLRRVEEIATHLPSRVDGSTVDRFEATYRRVIATHLDQVELFGVTVDDRTRCYPLSTAYVSLQMEVGGSRAHDEDSPATVSIEDALRAHRRILVRGEAGSGKTTLLQWLAVRAARGELDFMPVFLRLRRYSGRELPRPEEFLQTSVAHIADQMPAGWMHEQLAGGRALILVDGVDELPESRRDAARRWLQELVIAYPAAGYVVTSRPAAASGHWLDGAGFTGYETLPMGMADIQAFVDHWHAAMLAEYTDRAQLRDSARHLLDGIRSQRHLRRLATSPLLTALLCALHWDRRMHLPRDRMELYTVALEMLLDRRDRERSIGLEDLELSRTEKTILLQDIAYWLVRNGLSGAATDRITAQLDRRLAAMPRIEATGQQVLNLLLNRSGLVREPVAGQLDFVHKTFQEYLAAKAAIDADDIGVLVDHVTDDQWREVIVMAVAVANAGQREELVTALTDRAASGHDGWHVATLLAIACAHQAPTLPRALNARAELLAKHQLPPPSLPVAERMAEVGELALELLPAGPIAPEYRPSTVRMAGLIGGDHALSVIARCLRDKDEPFDRDSRQEMFRELNRAWPRFDPVRYAQQILDVDPFVNPEVTDPLLLPALRHIRKPVLWCRFGQGYGPLDYVGDMPMLESFQLTDIKTNDLTPLTQLPDLQSLVLRKTGEIDLAALAGCPRLTGLTTTLGSPDGKRGLRALEQLTSLEIYDAIHPDELLAALPPDMRLDRFGLWQSASVAGLRGLLEAEQLTALGFLMLNEVNALESLAGVEQWADTMRGVYLRGSRITDVHRLARLPKLNFANLARTPLDSVEFVQELPLLEILHIGGAGPLPDLTPLRSLTNLTDLFIYSRDADLSPLEGWENVTIHHEVS
ncbi:NACHT domain-containing protein [Pseudonocardiaceae bacterium YIM PH 21723]|nr:NACHT domain-containing protein [Pseudonocardiaceae bacterium YIM PH 21723]